MTDQVQELFRSNFWRVFDIWPNCAEAIGRSADRVRAEPLIQSFCLRFHHVRILGRNLTPIPCDCVHCSTLLQLSSQQLIQLILALRHFRFLKQTIDLTDSTMKSCLYYAGSRVSLFLATCSGVDMRSRPIAREIIHLYVSSILQPSSCPHLTCLPATTAYHLPKIAPLFSETKHPKNVIPHSLHTHLLWAQTLHLKMNYYVQKMGGGGGILGLNGIKLK